MKIIDDTRSELTVPDQPCRVVSLLPSVTETILALGGDRRLVGAAHRAGDHRAHLTRIGDVRSIDLTAVRELSPDLAIGSPRENVKEQLEAIEGLGIPVYRTCPRTVLESILGLMDFARILGLSAQGERLALNLLTDLDRVRQKVHEKPRPRAALAIGWKPLVLAGPGTLPGDLLRQAGGDNVAPPHGDPFPSVSLENFRLLDPDVVILSTSFFPFTSKHLEQIREEAPCTASCSDRVLVSNAPATTVPSVRVSHAVAELAGLLHASRESRL